MILGVVPPTTPFPRGSELPPGSLPPFFFHPLPVFWLNLLSEMTLRYSLKTFYRHHFRYPFHPSRLEWQARMALRWQERHAM